MRTVDDIKKDYADMNPRQIEYLRETAGKDNCLTDTLTLLEEIARLEDTIQGLDELMEQEQLPILQRATEVNEELLGLLRKQG